MAAKKKTVAKKATKKAVKKPIAKKAKVAAKKAKPKTKVSVKKSPSKKLGKIDKVYTKSELYNTIAERAELPKKDVAKVFGELSEIIEAHLKKGSIEKFTLPGILKMSVKKVAAKKARKGTNPFTGEETMFKAKPASKKVKISPLKSLKEMV